MMENANEKKWFVYMTDHHEGPFTAQQLQEMFETGRISLSSHAWCDGMADWTVIDQISSLAELSKPKSTQSGPTLVAASTEKSEPAAKESFMPILEVAPVSEDSAASPVSVSPLISLETKEEATNSTSPAPVISLNSASPQSKTTETLSPLKLEEKSETTNTDRVFGKVHNPDEWTKTDVRQFSAGRDIPTDTLVHAPKSAAKSNKTRLGILLLILACAVGGFYYWQQRGAKSVPTASTSSGPSWVSSVWSATLSTFGKLPVVGGYFSPLPSLADVKPEEMEELKTAARAPLKEGSKVAMALSQTDLASPKIYIATNLPDDTQLDVIFVGVPESLLNQTSFAERVQASVKKRLATTAPLRAADGGQIPRGQYFIYVVESQGQPSAVMTELASVPPANGNLPAKVLSMAPQSRGGKVFGSKALFLGGPKDDGYAQRLTEYHEKLQTKSQQELSELNQYYATLESQFTSTDAEFEKYLNGGKVTPAKAKAWAKFHDNFTALQNQLAQASAQWGGASPEALEKEYFYHMLYAHLQKLVLHVNQVHEHHQSFFAGLDRSGNMGKDERKAFEDKLAQLSSDCAQVLGAFKEKLDTATNTPPTANGMPVREGL